jgi:hypothetical protein
VEEEGSYCQSYTRSTNVRPDTPVHDRVRPFEPLLDDDEPIPDLQSEEEPEPAPEFDENGRFTAQSKGKARSK